MDSKIHRKWLLGIVNLLFISFSVISVFGAITVSWDPNPESDLSGYKIYYGTESRIYDQVIDVGNVTLYNINNLDNGNTYYFAVTAYDFSGNESEYSEEISVTLPSPDNNPPELVNIEVMGETQLDIVFSEPLDEGSVENSLNYSISGDIQVLDTKLDSNLTTVHLLTSSHEPGRSYVISVSDVKDIALNKIAQGTSLSYSLPRSSEDTIPPKLVLVEIINETELYVIFNEPIEQSSAATISNYSISDGIEVLQADLSDSLSVVRLTTTEHQRGVIYTLIVNNIRDLAPNPNVIEANSSMTYRLPSYSDDTSESDGQNSDTFVLFQNYPNPFNPNTEIRFHLPEVSLVVLKIFNTLGQEIFTLVDDQYEAGYNSVRWDGKDSYGNPVSSGVYLYQLQTGNFTRTKKMSLLR